VDKDNERILSGRVFSEKDFELLKTITADMFNTCREKIAEEICKRLNWVKIDGGYKVMSCKNVLLRLAKDGVIVLPEPKNKYFSKKAVINFTEKSEPKNLVECDLKELLPLKLVRATSKNERTLWNEFVHRYHYLGYTPFPGAQIKYFIESSQGILGCISFSASAWKTMPRDKWIGWTHEQRIAGLHLIINNSRYLILPWVNVKNLASKVLSLCAKQLPNDWLTIYKYKPVLLETFVEKDRFKGTCYLAANWKLVGLTAGRGKPDTKRKIVLPIKKIFMYPLTVEFRENLLGDPEPFR
jgi:hypothetical protein